MSSGALQKYTGRRDHGAGEPDQIEEAESEDFGAFGWLRGGSHVRAIMLDLRKRDGSRLAIGYSWISSIAFDPSVGITIMTTDRKISIVGQNLNAEARVGIRLYEGLLRQRITSISEAAHPQSVLQEGTPCTIVQVAW